MNSSKLRTQHVSLQFSDGDRQQEHDVRTLFAQGERFPIKTGTESGDDGRGGNDNFELLNHFAEKFNHLIQFAGDNWVAVDRDIVRRNTVTRDKVFVASSAEVDGPGHPRIFPVLSFEHINPQIGRIYQAAAHYPTRGRRPGEPNFDINVRYARKIQEWMQEVAKDSDLAFVNGDFNVPDNTMDWAYGGKFTSMADELKAWENTGHGPIDGFASYDRDARVSASKFLVLGDKALHMFTDHFVCRGVWEIRHLKRA